MCPLGSLEEGSFVLNPTHGVVVQNHTADTTILGERTRLWFDCLRSKDTLYRGQQGVSVQ